MAWQWRAVFARNILRLPPRGPDIDFLCVGIAGGDGLIGNRFGACMPPLDLRGCGLFAEENHAEKD